MHSESQSTMHVLRVHDSRITHPYSLNFQIVTNSEIVMISWGRLTTWKFPLLQLVAVFPRPPLSLLFTPFVLLHLLGDPISTISDTVLKLASCQARARFWRDKLEDEDCLGYLLGSDYAIDSTSSVISRWWKELGAISDSYDEWGQAKGNQVEDFILTQL